MAAPQLTELERKILSLVQQNLPDSATPFADVAAQAGCDEETVLALLRRLKAEGVIRRFGATLRHQKAGYGANAMVAWRLGPDDDPEAVGALMAARPEVSHCYQRRTYPDWTYSHYTMVHAKSREDCRRVAEEIAAETGVPDFELLFSVKELKKTSMSYFPEQPQ